MKTLKLNFIFKNLYKIFIVKKRYFFTLISLNLVEKDLDKIDISIKKLQLNLIELDIINCWDSLEIYTSAQKMTKKKKFFLHFFFSFINLVIKSFILFITGFELGSDKKDLLHLKSKFEFLYYLNRDSIRPLKDLSKPIYENNFFYFYKLYIKPLKHNLFVAIFMMLGKLSAFIFYMQLEPYCSNIYYIIFFFLFCFCSLLLTITSIFSNVSNSLYWLSSNDKITNIYITRRYDKFILLLGCLFFNLLNIILEISLLLIKITFFIRIPLIMEIEYINFIIKKFYSRFPKEIIEHTSIGHWMRTSLIGLFSLVAIYLLLI